MMTSHSNHYFSESHPTGWTRSQLKSKDYGKKEGITSDYR